MDHIAALRKVTLAAQRDQELPDDLAQRITRIAARLEQGSTVTGIDELIGQITDYDTYGQTGYLGMGVNHVILTRTIERIEEQL